MIPGDDDAEESALEVVHYVIPAGDNSKHFVAVELAIQAAQVQPA